MALGGTLKALPGLLRTNWPQFGPPLGPPPQRHRVALVERDSVGMQRGAVAVKPVHRAEILGALNPEDGVPVGVTTVRDPPTRQRGRARSRGPGNRRGAVAGELDH